MQANDTLNSLKFRNFHHHVHCIIDGLYENMRKNASLQFYIHIRAQEQSVQPFKRGLAFSSPHHHVAHFPSCIVVPIFGIAGVPISTITSDPTYFYVVIFMISQINRGMCFTRWVWTHVIICLPSIILSHCSHTSPFLSQGA